MTESFKNQDIIPSLPVPELSDTVELFLRCLKPLTDADSYEKTRLSAQEFLEGDGAVLQSKLLEYAASIKPHSWLMPYSLDIYLNMRKPVPIEGNFVFELSRLGVLEDCDYLGFVSTMAHCIGLVFLELANGNLPPLMARDTPLCMKQFEGSLRGTKIPMEGKDEFRIHKYEEVNTFGVFYKNRFYAVKLIDDNGNAVCPEKIYAALSEIYSDKVLSPDISFCIAGFAGSDKAARLIEKMCADAENAKSFDVVNKTMFNITLSDISSTEHTAVDKLYLGAEDAWPYKPWSITVYTDKICSFNIEHTSMDGLTHMHLIERMINKMKEINAPVSFGEKTAIEGILTPINFNIDSVMDELATVKKDYLNDINQFLGAVYTREALPVKTLKERKIGVDFYLQLAYQYAQLAAFGEMRCTHESVSVTQFYEGRTSEIRTVSEEAVRFIKALVGSAAQDELDALLAKACEEHSARVKASKAICSFIRHSAGLKDMFVRFGAELGISCMPELFSDPNFIRYCTQEISTSTVGNAWFINKFAFAPQTGRGLGIGYITHGDTFIADVSYYKDEQGTYDKFKNSMDEYFNKMQTLLIK